jgi:restriction endonuclease S subunit
MGIRKISLKQFALDPKLGLKDYSLINSTKGYRLKNILKNTDVSTDIKSGRTPSKYNPDYWLGDIEFLTMQDINTSTYVLMPKVSAHITKYAVENEKTLYQAPANSLIVSNAMTIGLAFIVDRPIYLNQNVFHFNIDETKYNITFLKWYFNLKIRKAFQSIFASKYYSKDEYSRLILPNIDIALQNEFATKIKELELELNLLDTSRTLNVDIINNVIAEELDFNLETFKKLKAENKFSSNLKEFGNNIDCRFSFKFHNRAGQFVWDFLSSKTNKRIKDFISEPIVLGKSVSPKDYDDDGDYFYIAMSNIKTWAFDAEGCKTVSNAYSKSNMNKSVKKDDIILARSGEGTIGKVALIENEEIKAIHADFTQRIRLTNYNPRLAYYYMRSDLFQYLVYTHKKGLGNNTNIFPSQVQEFPIPDWDETKQTELVDKIKTQIDAQKEIDKQIAEKQAEISAIIEKALETE